MSDNDTKGPKATTPAASRNQSAGHGKKQPKPGNRRGQQDIPSSNVDLHPPADSIGHEDEAGATEPTQDQIEKQNAKPKPDVEQPEELGSGEEVAPIGTVLQDIPADKGPDASKDDPSNLQVVVADDQ